MDKYDVGSYQVVVCWSDEDGRFLAEMPELPGCMADGRSEEEARTNIQAVARDWVKMAQYLGREVPAPSSLTYA